MPQPTPAIPKGSWVLVTGATGYIASHIILQLLDGGYKVRGTVRDLNRAAWLKNDLFAKFAESGSFELSLVPDLAAPGAYDESVKGMSGVIHVATIATWAADPNEVIPQTVRGALNALESAAKEAQVTRFVYTSTAGSATMLVPNVKFHVDPSSWNDAVAALAWAPPPYEPSRGVVVYMQSKVEAEKAVWTFAEKNKPGFVVNAVLPFTTLGQVLNDSHWSTTPGFIRQVWNGQMDGQVQAIPCGKLPIGIKPSIEALADLNTLEKQQAIYMFVTWLLSTWPVY